jgi:hypothetical protein
MEEKIQNLTVDPYCKKIQPVFSMTTSYNGAGLPVNGPTTGGTPGTLPGGPTIVPNGNSISITHRFSGTIDSNACKVTKLEKPDKDNYQ